MTPFRVPTSAPPQKASREHVSRLNSPVESSCHHCHHLISRACEGTCSDGYGEDGNGGRAYAYAFTRRAWEVVSGGAGGNTRGIGSNCRGRCVPTSRGRPGNGIVEEVGTGGGARAFQSSPRNGIAVTPSTPPNAPPLTRGSGPSRVAAEPRQARRQRARGASSARARTRHRVPIFWGAAAHFFTRKRASWGGLNAVRLRVHASWGG